MRSVGESLQRCSSACVVAKAIMGLHDGAWNHTASHAKCCTHPVSDAHGMLQHSPLPYAILTLA